MNSIRLYSRISKPHRTFPMGFLISTRFESFRFTTSSLVSSSSSSSDTDICRKTAEALFSMERFHRNNSIEEERKQVERQAWRELQKLPDSAVDNAGVNEITDILGAWCYFSRFWARGMQGPEEEEINDEKSTKKDIVIPIVQRLTLPVNTPTADQAPPPRANPLDEVLDF